jgi:hypothetical protein
MYMYTAIARRIAPTIAPIMMPAIAPAGSDLELVLPLLFSLPLLLAEVVGAMYPGFVFVITTLESSDEMEVSVELRALEEDEDAEVESEKLVDEEEDVDGAREV